MRWKPGHGAAHGSDIGSNHSDAQYGFKHGFDWDYHASKMNNNRC
jgi:hypothetical protein